MKVVELSSMLPHMVLHAPVFHLRPLNASGSDQIELQPEG